MPPASNRVLRILDEARYITASYPLQELSLSESSPTNDVAAKPAPLNLGHFSTLDTSSRPTYT
jgi:hypothetical protein